MEQPHAHDPVRDTRTIRKAAPRHPMRPFLVGIGVVAVLGGAIVAASRYERAQVGDPAALVSPGAMHVEETEVLPQGLAAGTKPDAGARGTGPVPVKFYEVLEKGDQAAVGGGEMAMRSMPLPPPPEDAKAVSKSVAQATAPAKRSAPAVALTVPDESAPAHQSPITETPAPQAPKAATPAAGAATPASMSPAGPPAGVPMERPYTLQVGSFSRKDGAEELVGRLKGKGHEAYVAEVDLGSKGVWYRVRVGRYPTEHAAKWARLDLVREGLSPIVVHDPKGP